MRRLALCSIFLFLVGPLAGCALLYELQPHRLQRWNRGPAPSMDPDFTTMKSDSADHAVADSNRNTVPVCRAQQ